MKYLLLLMLSFPVFADTANGSFVPPDQRVDGSILAPSEIGGYSVYLDGVATQTLSSTATTFTLTLTGGVYELVITTIDTDGRESDPSEVVSINVPFTPNAPTGITITISI